MHSMFYYRPQRSWGKVIFSQASVILLTEGGVSDQADTPPQDQVHHPWAETPPPLGRHTPQVRHSPRSDTHPPRSDTSQVRHPPRTKYTPLRLSTTPRTKYTPPPRYGQRAGGTHPTGMQTCFTVYFNWNWVENLNKQCSQDPRKSRMYALYCFSLMCVIWLGPV